MTPQSTILVIEDDQALADMLKAYFNIQGYEVLTSAWGEQGIKVAQEQVPDLILLDVRLPDIDGFEVAQRLKTSHRARHIPILFLTEKSERVDKLKGLSLGTVDYITKPFDIQEVRLRVRNTLNRIHDMGRENAITGLPEGSAVDEALADLKDVNWAWSLTALSIEGLDDFRDAYGFVASDDVLRVAGMTICRAAEDIALDDAFCGHLYEHTFIVLLPEADVSAFLERVDERLIDTLDYFYPAGNDSTSDAVRLHLKVGTIATTVFESVEELKDAVFRSRSAY